MRFDGHLVSYSSASAPRRLEPPKETSMRGSARGSSTASPGSGSTTCACGWRLGRPGIRLYSADPAVAVVEPN
jgi:hypothetical protein